MAMPIPEGWLDFGSQTLTATSTVDSSFTVPANSAATSSSLTTAAAVRNHLSLYMLIVSGVPAHINIGIAATSSNIELPVGVYGPLELQPGSAIHAITDAGTGQVGIVRWRL